MGVVVPVGYGLASIEMTASFGTSPFYTTIGVDLGDAGGDFVGAANSVMSAFGSGLIGRIGDQFTVQGVNLHVGADGPSGSVRSTYTAFAGTRTSSSDAVAMAACVYKQTAGLGRSARGRALLPGVLAESDVGAAGTIDLSPKTAILNGYLDFLEALVSPGTGFVAVPPVLLHSPEVGTIPSPIVGAAIRDKVAWVRGRLF